MQRGSRRVFVPVGRERSGRELVGYSVAGTKGSDHFHPRGLEVKSTSVAPESHFTKLAQYSAVLPSRKLESMRTTGVMHARRSTVLLASQANSPSSEPLSFVCTHWPMLFPPSLKLHLRKPKAAVGQRRLLEDFGEFYGVSSGLKIQESLPDP